MTKNSTNSSRLFSLINSVTEICQNADDRGIVFIKLAMSDNKDVLEGVLKDIKTKFANSDLSQKLVSALREIHSMYMKDHSLEKMFDDISHAIVSQIAIEDYVENKKNSILG